jgi:hypothetical protein
VTTTAVPCRSWPLVDITPPRYQERREWVDIPSPHSPALY